MPQHHKGDRTYVPARVPTPYAKKMERMKEVTGESKSDIITAALAAYLDKIDVENIGRNQDPLPLSA